MPTHNKKAKARKKAIKGGMPTSVANKVIRKNGGTVSGKKKAYGNGGMTKGKTRRK